MGLQQNRFPMGKSGGTNWWPWIIGGSVLLFCVIILFHKKENSSVMPSLSSRETERKNEENAMKEPVIEKQLTANEKNENNLSESLPDKPEVNQTQLMDHDFNPSSPA